MKSYNVILSETVQNAVDRINSMYVETEESVQSQVDFIRVLEKEVNALEIFPYRGFKLNMKDFEVRAIIINHYAFCYMVEKDTVIILYICHASSKRFSELRGY